jgi:hypothetical protein
MSDIEHLAKKALREAISFAHGNLYTTTGRAWRQIIASLAFETKADLSLIQYFDEQDQARFHLITQGFINRDLEVGDLIDAYLEFFPRPKEWRDLEL